MTLTNFPNGVSSFGIPVLGTGGASGLGSIPIGDNYWFVDSNYGNDGYPGTWDLPVATLSRALALAALAAGDNVITLKTGHAETITSAGGTTVSLSAVRIVGLGTGNNRPTFTFSTATTASLLFSGSNVSFTNIIGRAGINSLANPFDVTGNDVTLDITWQDVSGSYEAVRVVRGVSAARLNINLRHEGVAGSAVNLSCIYLNACSEVEINLDTYGTSGTAVVNFFTGACTGVRVSGQIYNSGNTTGLKNVVDTATGSTYWVEVFDGAAGTFMSGGSATSGTLSPASPSAVANALYGTGVVTWPVSAAHGNSVSMAAVLGYIQDAIRNGTGGTALATNKSLYDALGTDGTTPVSTVSSLFGVLGINSATNNFVSSAVTANRTGSILNRLADLIDQEEKSVATTVSAGVAQATVPIFVVAGGPIVVKGVYAVCTAANGAGASTMTFSHTATAGGAVAISGASASLANAVIGTLVFPIGVFATAASVVTAPAAIATAALPTSIQLPPGTLNVIIGTAAMTGSWQFIMSYTPLQPGVTVTASF